MDQARRGMDATHTWILKSTRRRLAVSLASHFELLNHLDRPGDTIFRPDAFAYLRCPSLDPGLGKDGIDCSSQILCRQPAARIRPGGRPQPAQPLSPEWLVAHEGRNDWGDARPKGGGSRPRSPMVDYRRHLWKQPLVEDTSNGEDCLRHFCLVWSPSGSVEHTTLLGAGQGFYDHLDCRFSTITRHAPKTGIYGRPAPRKSTSSLGGFQVSGGSRNQ
jgi:hypothetical protein